MHYVEAKVMYFLQCVKTNTSEQNTILQTTQEDQITDLIISQSQEGTNVWVRQTEILNHWRCVGLWGVPGSPRFLQDCQQQAAEAAPTSLPYQKWWRIACCLRLPSHWWAWRWRLLAAPPHGAGLQRAHWQSTWNREGIHHHQQGHREHFAWCTIQNPFCWFIFCIHFIKIAGITCTCSCSLGWRTLKGKHRWTKSISILKLQPSEATFHTAETRR